MHFGKPKLPEENARYKLQDKEEYEYVIIESATPSLGSVFSGVFWCFLVFSGVFWCFLVFSGVFWRK
jgi:hypothetical protein